MKRSGVRFRVRRVSPGEQINNGQRYSEPHQYFTLLPKEVPEHGTISPS